MPSKTATARKVWLETHGQWAHFVNRAVMDANRPMRAKASLPKAVPATTLPVDCTGNATVSCPMLGNDQYGDCGPVMCAHVNQIRTYGQGKAGFGEITVNQSALVAQYEKISGGDNGTDETMLVGAAGAWTAAGGGIAGDPTAVVADHLDIDVTDAPLTQYCLDQFYAVCVAWSVPDDVLQKFTQGIVFAAAGVPNPNNGHYTPLADVGGPSDVGADGTNVNGFYRLWTWGTWCWVAPVFVASVQPQSFVTFSALQFNKAGYDSHGRHVSDQAAAWVNIGGNASLVAAIVAQFPAKSAPPVPTPTPPGPTPTGPVTLAMAQQWAAAGIDGGHPLMTRAQAKAAANAGLAQGFGSQP